jgi:hypothetical protein
VAVDDGTGVFSVVVGFAVVVLWAVAAGVLLLYGPFTSLSIS